MNGSAVAGTMRVLPDTARGLGMGMNMGRSARASPSDMLTTGSPAMSVARTRTPFMAPESLEPDFPGPGSPGTASRGLSAPAGLGRDHASRAPAALDQGEGTEEEDDDRQHD